LLKAKYYPSGELIDTAFIKNTSPSWQGVMHGLDLLKRGVIWRINSGSKVQIWRDNWLPRGNLKVIGKSSNSRIRWVSDLIDPSTKLWKEDLVRKLFHEADADYILRIKLPSFTGNDYLAWHHERNGIFSVKSAYKLASDIQSGASIAGTSTNDPGKRDMWNLVWKAKVPPKVKVFGWKLATNSLGVQDHRCKRKMDIVPTCNICGVEPETRHHAMIECTKAKALRQRMRNDWDLPAENMFRYTGAD
jgi:hypothetical protein